MTDLRPARARPSVWIDDFVEQPAGWPLWVVVAFTVGIVIYLATIADAIQTGNPRVLAATAVIPPLVIITALIARWLARHDNDPSITPMVMGAFAVKLIGSAVRYWTAFSLYNGIADASAYDKAARPIASQWRSLNPIVNVGPGRFAGTNFMKLLTGLVYTVTPASRISGFLVFAWISFIGFLIYWRAFRIAFPHGDTKKYAMLVLLLPSLVFWPSSIGKDAWMALVLAITAYGAARISAGMTASGLFSVLLGTAGVLVVRPHLAICTFAGLTVLMLLICTQIRRMHRPALPLVALLLLVVVGNVVVHETTKFLGVPSLTQEGVSTTLANASQQSSQGGSEFKPVSGNNPVTFPLAFATVFYRPLPFEVHNAQQLIAATEGVVLIGLTIASRKNLAAIKRNLRPAPFVGYCLGFIIVFVVAFSAFSNFGLLARERTQVLPLYLVLLALPSRKPALDPSVPDDAAPAAEPAAR